MIEWSATRPIAKYRVRVGHHSVTVESTSAEEAILEARRLMSLEMPRLWDLIHTMDSTQFQVDAVPLVR